MRTIQTIQTDPFLVLRIRWCDPMQCRVPCSVCLSFNNNNKQQYPIPRQHRFDPTHTLNPTVLPILVNLMTSCAVYPLMDVRLANYVSFQRFQCQPKQRRFYRGSQVLFFSLDEILAPAKASSAKASSCAQ